MRTNWLKLLALGALAMAATSGCAQEREPINRVQANAMAKSFFVGADLQGPSDDPEFYTQGTLIDVGYGASQDGLFTSTYAQPVSRMKWQITEDLLIGRLTYERIDNSDGKGAGPTASDGVITVMYPVLSHFDIKRGYNPQTGEDLNIVEENTSDRPWYEREYMRVDWSRNLNTDSYDFDTLSLVGIYGGIQYEPVSYYVNDPTDPNAPHFDTQNGYFDVTNKAFAKPGEVDLSHLGWGIDTFPSCFLPDEFAGGSAPDGTCNPVELTIRQSFRRVEKSDYEPVDWDGRRFAAYGGFYTERFGYERNYGMTDDRWHRLLNRYNIWERHHFYTDPANMAGEIKCFTPETTPFGANPHRDDNQDGTEDECAGAGAGSKCDTFSQKCTLPYQQRTAKPVVWYYSTGNQQDYFAPTADASNEWDVAIRTSVQVAKYSECMVTNSGDCATKFPMYFGQQNENVNAVRLAAEVDACRHAGQPEATCVGVADQVGAARGYSPGVIAIARMPEMVILCHSPVEAGDPAACGSPRLPANITAEQCHSGDTSVREACNGALQARRGDLRYNQVTVIPEPQTPSPWGIMVDSDDPLTGEKIASSINVWSHVNDLFAQKTVDVMRFIKGELDSSQLTEGTYIKNWSEAAQAASGGSILPRVSAEDLKETAAAFANKTTADFDFSQPLPKNSDVMVAARNLRKEMEGVAANIEQPSTMRARYAARRNRAQGSDMEAQLITPEMQQYAGVANLALTDLTVQQASPLRMSNPSVQRDLRNFRELALAQRGACMLQEAPAPLALNGLADAMQRKFAGQYGDWGTGDGPAQAARAAAIERNIALRAHYAVILHEMGHSIGHRHNFISSSDARNYRAQYWQLRTNNGSLNTKCNQVSADGENCIGPRYFDPVNANERDNMIWMFMQSSVMDYAGEPSQDLIGLGAYDFAAARMFYGEAVAVYGDPSYNAGTPRGQGTLGKEDNFGGILGIQPTLGDTDIHYSELQSAYELIKDCQPIADPQLHKPSDWNSELYGEWDPLLDGLMVSVNGQFASCQEQPVDYVPWNSLRMPTAGEAGQFYRGGASVDPTGRTRVPYGFATDSWADLGNASVYRHDNGADTYEIYDFLITQQELYHIFDNYRRNRADFSVRSAANRTLGRYNEKIRDGAKGLSLFVNIYKDFALENGWDFDQLWPVIAVQSFPDQILASGMVFDHFARLVSRPQAGPHYRELTAGGKYVLRSTDDSYKNSPFGLGGSPVNIPNGATGAFGDIGIGGKPLENSLADDRGEYDRDYTLNAGSYYDKAWTPMLMTESVDNFISSSRNDFLDARFRSVSLADLFPEGYRRWLSNMLTGDEYVKGAHLEANAQNIPLTDMDGYPSKPIGWTTWWTAQPEVCFTNNGTRICSAYGQNGTPFNPGAPANMVAVDGQVGFEQQKFLIAMTMMYLPENQQQWWINQFQIWEMGADSDPGFPNRIEYHDPTGKVFVARTYGKESVFGKMVHRGIGARVLEWANELLASAYVTQAGPDNDNDGKPDWYIPVIAADGQPTIKYDASIISPTGVPPNPNCTETNNSGCTCASNKACMALSRYASIPLFIRQALSAYGLADPSMRGLY